MEHRSFNRGFLFCSHLFGVPFSIVNFIVICIIYVDIFLINTWMDRWVDGWMDIVETFFGDLASYNYVRPTRTQLRPNQYHVGCC